MIERIDHARRVVGTLNASRFYASEMLDDCPCRDPRTTRVVMKNGLRRDRIADGSYGLRDQRIRSIASLPRVEGSELVEPFRYRP